MTRTNFRAGLFGRHTITAVAVMAATLAMAHWPTARAGVTGRPADTAPTGLLAFQASSGYLNTVDQDGLHTTYTEVAAYTHPATTVLASGAHELALHGPDDLLWITGPDGVGNRAGGELGVATGTSPAIAADATGGWEIAFHAAGTDHLWTVRHQAGETDDGGLGIPADSGEPMLAGASPSIAWHGSGFVSAFAGSDELARIFDGTTTRLVGSGLGVATSTGPAVAGQQDGGWLVALHGTDDHLWTVRNPDGSGVMNDVTTRTDATVQTGSSPSAAPLQDGTGRYWLAFAAPDGTVHIADAAGHGTVAGSGYRVAPNTSPAIASDEVGGWEIAFHAKANDRLSVVLHAAGATDDRGRGIGTDTGFVLAPGADPDIDRPLPRPSRIDYDVVVLAGGARVGYGAVTGRLTLALQPDGGNYRGRLLDYSAQKAYVASVDASNPGIPVLTFGSRNGTFAFTLDSTFGASTITATARTVPGQLGVPAAQVFLRATNHAAQTTTYAFTLNEVLGPLAAHSVYRGTLKIVSDKNGVLAAGTITILGSDGNPVTTPITTPSIADGTNLSFEATIGGQQFGLSATLTPTCGTFEGVGFTGAGADASQWGFRVTTPC